MNAPSKEQAQDGLEAPPPAEPTGNLLVSTQFMETYEILRPVTGGGDLSTFMNSQGRLDLYSSGTGSRVFRIRPQEDASSGWIRQDLGIEASQLAPYNAADPDNPNILGVTHDGKLSLSHWDENLGKYVQRPSEPPKATRTLQRFLATESLGNVFANVILDNDTVASSYLKPDGTWGSSDWVPLKGDDGQPAKVKRIAMCSNNPRQTSLYAIGMQNEVLFAQFSGRFSDFKRLGFLDGIALDVVEDDESLLNVFAIDTDHHLHQKREKKHYIGTEIQWEDWKAIDDTTELKSVRAVINIDGVIEIFGIGTDNLLYTTRQMTDDEGNVTGWSSMFPLGVAVPNSIFTVGRDRAGYFEAFSVTPESQLYRFHRNPRTTQWITENIRLEDSGEMTSVPTHSVEIKVLDAGGLPQANTPVRLNASTLVPLRVNGKYYFADEFTTLRLTSNSAGILSIARVTDSLSAPTLEINTNFMQDGESVTIEPNAQLQRKMHETTKEDVKASGLLKGEFDNDETAESIAKIMRQSMSLGMKPETTAASLPYLTRNASGIGLRHFHRTHRGSRFQIDPGAVPHQHWEIDFSSGQPRFRELTFDEADRIFVDALAAALPESIFGGWTWGDIWEAIKNGVGEIFEGLEKFIVHTIPNAVTGLVDKIKVAFKFVIDGIEHWFEDTIQFFQQAFDIVEGIWNKVKVFFEDLYKWLAFLFDWKDIVRTSEAVVHCINTTFDFADMGLEALKNGVKDGFETFKRELETGVDAFLKTLDPTQTIDGYSQAHAKPNQKFQDSTSHNVLLNGFVDNGHATEVLARSVTAGIDESVLDTLIEKLTELGENFKFGDSKRAFDQAMAYFEQIGENPQNALTLILEGLVKLAEALALILIDVAEGVFLSIIDLTRDVLALAKGMLNDTWHIPFVSELYELITGKELGFKPIDLFALILAVPSTVFYKIAFDKAPFPDAKSVDELKSRFTADWLAERAGIQDGRQSPEALAHVESLEADGFWEFVKAFFDVLAAGSWVVRIPLESVQIEGTSTRANVSWQWDCAVVTCRLANSLLAVPAFRSHKAPGLVWATWGLQIVCGPGLRGYGFVLWKRAGKGLKLEGLPDIILSIWGLIHLVLASVRVGVDPGKPTADAVDIMGTTTPQLFRFMTQPDIPYQPVWGTILFIVGDIMYGAMALTLVIGDATNKRAVEAFTLQAA